MKHKNIIVSVVIAFLFLLVFLPPAISQTQFDPQLVEAAKKEGKVTIYNSGAREAVDSLLKAFKEKFGISGEQYRATSHKIFSKIIEEIQAKSVYCDVVTMGSPNVLELELQGALQELNLKEAQYYPEAQKTKYWVNVAGIGLFIMYNTDLVKKEEAPKEWKDLLNPKWKGHIAMPDWRASTSPMIVYKMLRDLYGTEFLKKAGEQGFRVYEAHGGAADAVARGECAISFEMLSDRIAVQVKKGAPVGYSVPTPTAFNPRQLGIPKGAPRPNAARLVSEFVLSKEGQKIYNVDYWLYSFRPDIEYPEEMYPLSKIKLYDFTPKMWIDFNKELPTLIEEADKLWLKK